MGDRLNNNDKDALLEFMEKHADFARGRVKGQQAAQIMNSLLEKLRRHMILKTGKDRSRKQWKEVWSTMRSDAKQDGCSNGVPKPTKTGGGEPSDEDEDEEPFHIENPHPYTLRVMKIIGWEVAMGVGVTDDLSSSDEDKEVEENNVEETVVEETVVEARVAECVVYTPSTSELFNIALANLAEAIQNQQDAVQELASVFITRC